MKKILFVLSMFIGGYAYAGGTSTPTPIIIPTSVIASSTSASGGQAQVLITTPTATGAYSTGYYTYLTNIHIEMYPTANLVGAGGPTFCTSTGIGNSPQWGFSTNQSSGVVSVTDMQFANPLQSTQASNVAITCPATSNIRWNVHVGYFQAS